MTTYNPIDFACDLITRPSITPDDAGCQAQIAEWLSQASFAITHLPFGAVDNMWATHGTKGPTLCFVGHTDVVPSGKGWKTDPFTPIIKDGFLYGRGAQDMKGPLAAMITAALDFVTQYPAHPGRIAFLLTSDEEGPSVDGIGKAFPALIAQGEQVEFALVGEPSCTKTLGDTLKRGRRGSLSATLKILGKQGHIAYPHLADNAIHKVLPFLTELLNTTFDAGYPNFPATHLACSNIQAGVGANNVIPGELTLQFNIRYNPSSTLESLQAKIEQLLKTYDLSYTLEWRFAGGPFYTPDGPFLDAVTSAITEYTGIVPHISTDGGTSDGRFLAPFGVSVVEFGCTNTTIHQVNECVSVQELYDLSKIYKGIIEKILGANVTT